MGSRQRAAVSSDDFARYVPYALGKSSAGLGWRGLRAEVVRGHEAGEIELPALDHHLLNLIVAVPTLHEHRWDGRAAEERGREGAASLVPAGRESYWRWEYLRPGTACDFHLHLQPSFVRRVAMEDLNGAPRAAELRGELCFYSAPVQHLGAALLAEVELGGPQGALYAESLATALVVALLRSQGQVDDRGAGRGRAPVEAIAGVCAYIEEQLCAELHLVDLAERAGLGPRRFAEVFRAVMGTSAHQYVLERRIERSKQLLAASPAPLSEVALQLGFSDHAHFSTSFRRRTGMTPSRYRMECRR